MGLFEELQKNWQGQGSAEIPEAGIEAIRSRLDFIRRKSRVTFWILLITAIAVGGFFLYTQSFTLATIRLAMALMLGGVVLRITFEILGPWRLKRIDPTLPSAEFQKRLFRYYSHRKWVHFLVTPVSLIAYGAGFSFLLPFFQSAFSPWFYTYILISGCLLSVGLILLIIAQARRELEMLRQLESKP